MSKFQLGLIIVLFAFGCVACGDSPEFANYELQGIVTDNNSLPIKDIRVVREATDFLLFSDTTYTDVNGKYDFYFTDYYDSKATFKLKIEDVDVALNGGEFATQNLKVSYSNASWSFSKTAKESTALGSKTYDIKLQLK